MDHESNVRGVGPSRRLRDDEFLGPVVARIGERQLEPADAFFPRFVTSIIRQQVSMAAAAAIEERLQEAVELTPARVLETEPSQLREAGLSAQKAETVRAVAEKFDRGDWTRERFSERSDDAVIEELTSVRGVGVWTAKMQLLFSLARPDIFPVEDLGIRRGVQILTDEDLSRQEMVTFSERWTPVRSVASLYLWELSD